MHSYMMYGVFYQIYLIIKYSSGPVILDNGIYLVYIWLFAQLTWG